MGQSSGVLFEEVSASRRCPIIEVLLYIYIHTYIYMYVHMYVHAGVVTVLLCETELYW